VSSTPVSHTTSTIDAADRTDPSDVAAAASPDGWYATRAAAHLVSLEQARRWAGRLSAVRLLLALASILAAVAWSRTTGDARALAAITIACVAAFAAVVRAHRRARAREQASDLRHTVNLRGIARVHRTWADLTRPVWSWRGGESLPPVADDLALVGDASLSRLLDVVTPALGGPRLLDWLLADPPDAQMIEARQAAVRALAARPELLEWWAATAESGRSVSTRTLARFVDWTGVPSAGRLGVLRAAAWAGPALLVLAASAGTAHLVPLGPVVGLALMLNLAAAGLVRRRVAPMLAALNDVPLLLRPVHMLLSGIVAEPVDADEWRALQQRSMQGGGPSAFDRLARILTWSEVHYSPLLHSALNALLVWDVHVLDRLERWRATSGAAVRDWLDATADAEALVALATLAHDNPSWAFPALIIPDDRDETQAVLEARELGHPLLSPTSRVGNPVLLGERGSTLVVSGSNMAGKTTLLRAIGLDVLLAQAGAPACASQMRWQRMRVRTSIRIQDAPGEGVSLFLAELRRLKEIVDAAADSAYPPVLYLLDEVLHGTNSGDRRTATRAVLARLRALGAVGVVTTHDLELADDPALSAHTAHLHFREQYDAGDSGPRMTFDYRARPGRATGANALALLEALGLGSSTLPH
jgi:hypothetical protein